MRKILIFGFVLQLVVISGFCQSFSFDLSKLQHNHRFDFPSKEITGFRLDAIGLNYQFFDHPFFKFSSEKYSVNAVFTSASAANFGLEYISIIPVLTSSN